MNAPKIPNINLYTSARLFLTGMAMGGADIVPGVSGGTIAFIFGIYEELLESIKLLSGEVLGLVLKGKIVQAFKTIPFSFLIPVGLGVLVSLASLASIISYLLAEKPAYLWSFFFGLVIASIILVRKRVVTWNMHDYAALILASIGTYFLVGAVPVETPNTPLALFLSGAIAICAMILPGISGSFLLVIMGKYEQVLGAVVDKDIATLAIFAAGALFGLAVFSRLLSWLFNKHHDLILSVLIGFMIGSLRKIWPWKEVIMTRINSHGEIVPLVEKNILPAQFDLFLITCLALAVLGVITILVLDHFQATKEQVLDINDPDFVKEHAKAVSSQKSGKI